ncbi:MAG: protein kinase [Gemmatimonadota bacterium]
MMSEGHTSRLESALAGRYRIDKKLGEGGMASVYLAEDIKHERKVALKILKPELAAVIGAERFLAEIKTTANLQHPHILPLFDSGEADSFLCTRCWRVSRRTRARARRACWCGS